MELQFQKQEVSCLQRVLSQIQNLELTQDLRLPEGLPGLDQILGCWGQILIRSKEWQRENIRVSGGIQAWILYTPEEGEHPQRLETWIPFQMDWDLPADKPEGIIQVSPRLRFMDARPVSAGKVLVRASLALLAQCWSPYDTEVYLPEQVPEEIQLRQDTWLLQLPKEAGEKVFPLEEEMTLPASMPGLERILGCQLDPVVSDSKVLTDKVVFRGSGRLHVLYICEDGNVHNWETELPFSQYAQLKSSHTPDAGAFVTAAVTSLEMEADSEGRLHLKGLLMGQYLVEDREGIQTASDVWSPVREAKGQCRDLELETLLDARQDAVRGETCLHVQADRVIDAQFWPDFARQHREGDVLCLEQGGTLQLLIQDREGKLCGSSHRVEGKMCLKADESVLFQGIPQRGQVQTTPSGEDLTVRWEIPLYLHSWAKQTMPMLTAVEMGEKQELDPGRPSLILRRAGTDQLWEIAKASGSSVAMIREANDLQGQPDPDRLLLIPVI